jgi:hypothetical protein
MTSLGASRHKPKESNPGPKFAIVAGDDTTARSNITWTPGWMEISCLNIKLLADSFLDRIVHRDLASLPNILGHVCFQLREGLIF